MSTTESLPGKDLASAGIVTTFITNGVFVIASIPVTLDGLWPALIVTASFGSLGLVLLLVGFKAFETITRRLDIEKQLEDRNMAVGVVVAALLLGLSMIIVVSML